MQATLYNDQNSGRDFSPRFETSSNVLKLEKNSIPEEPNNFQFSSQLSSALAVNPSSSDIHNVTFQNHKDFPKKPS